MTDDDRFCVVFADANLTVHREWYNRIYWALSFADLYTMQGYNAVVCHGALGECVYRGQPELSKW